VPHLLVNNVEGPVASPLEPLKLDTRAPEVHTAAGRELHIPLASEVGEEGTLEDHVAALPGGRPQGGSGVAAVLADVAGARGALLCLFCQLQRWRGEVEGVVCASLVCGVS
jgi:hypothetical protein